LLHLYQRWSQPARDLWRNWRQG